MQADQEKAERQGGARSGLVRGILVIFTAVAIGAFVLSQGLDDADTETVAAGTEVAVGGGDANAADDPATTDDTQDPTGADAESGDGGAASDDPAAGGDPAAGDPASGETADSTGSGTEDAVTEESTSTTTVAGPIVQVPDQVKVLVLNGAGAKGIAGRGAAILQDAAYDVLAPKNADVLGPSLVLYAEGYEEAAVAVAKVFGADPLAVVKAYDPANKPIADTQDANIIVVVGQDGLIDV